MPPKLLLWIDFVWNGAWIAYPGLEARARLSLEVFVPKAPFDKCATILGGQVKFRGKQQVQMIFHPSMPKYIIDSGPYRT